MTFKEFDDINSFGNVAFVAFIDASLITASYEHRFNDVLEQFSDANVSTLMSLFLGCM